MLNWVVNVHGVHFYAVFEWFKHAPCWCVKVLTSLSLFLTC